MVSVSASRDFFNIIYVLPGRLRVSSGLAVTGNGHKGPRSTNAFPGFGTALTHMFQFYVFSLSIWCLFYFKGIDGYFVSPWRFDRRSFFIVLLAKSARVRTLVMLAEVDASLTGCVSRVLRKSVQDSRKH